MIEVGDRAADFTLLDQHGEKFRLRDHRGKPLVLVFYLFDFSPV